MRTGKIGGTHPSSPVTAPGAFPGAREQKSPNLKEHTKSWPRCGGIAIGLSCPYAPIELHLYFYLNSSKCAALTVREFSFSIRLFFQG